MLSKDTYREISTIIALSIMTVKPQKGDTKASEQQTNEEKGIKQHEEALEDKLL
jgi:hypothetical protein